MLRPGLGIEAFQPEIEKPSGHGPAPVVLFDELARAQPPFVYPFRVQHDVFESIRQRFKLNRGVDDGTVLELADKVVIFRLKAVVAGV